MLYVYFYNTFSIIFVFVYLHFHICKHILKNICMDLHIACISIINGRRYLPLFIFPLLYLSLYHKHIKNRTAAYCLYRHYQCKSGLQMRAGGKLAYIRDQPSTASTLSFEKSRHKKKRVAKPGPVGTKRYASSDVRCRDDGK